MMKRALLIAVILPALLASACAKGHYARMHDNEVVFYYKNRDAREVFFVSSLDDYRPHAARENRKHLWEASVPAGGSFAYFYIVDGVVTLPDCPLTENDDYGSRNCIYPAEM